MMFKNETSKISKHLLYMSITLNAGEVEPLVQQNQYPINFAHTLLQFCVFYTVSYEVDEIERLAV